MLEFKEGRLVDVSDDGPEAKKICKDWIDGFSDPNIYRLDYFSQGVKVGGLHWNAASHTDGIVLYSTIILDGELIE